MQSDTAHLFIPTLSAECAICLFGSDDGPFECFPEQDLSGSCSDDDNAIWNSFIECEEGVVDCTREEFDALISSLDPNCFQCIIQQPRGDGPPPIGPCLAVGEPSAEPSVDCEGTPNGDAEEDSCGVCNGGDADMDSCGVCNGGDADMDVCGEVRTRPILIAHAQQVDRASLTVGAWPLLGVVGCGSPHTVLWRRVELRGLRRNAQRRCRGGQLRCVQRRRRRHGQLRCVQRRRRRHGRLRRGAHSSDLDRTCTASRSLTVGAWPLLGVVGCGSPHTVLWRRVELLAGLLQFSDSRK
eukprot:SAG31_NODE_2879_length_4960_cov_13.684839_5_plen_297_part_00